jgi:hypothetical protein
MKPELLHILQHSLGVDQYGRGAQYRNHYVAGPGSNDFFNCLALCANGLMKDRGAQSMCGGMHYFQVTEEGKRAMREHSPNPPKLTRSQKRYREFIDSGAADVGMTFREFLMKRR